MELKKCTSIVIRKREGGRISTVNELFWVINIPSTASLSFIGEIVVHERLLFGSILVGCFRASTRSLARSPVTNFSILITKLFILYIFGTQSEKAKPNTLSPPSLSLLWFFPDFSCIHRLNREQYTFSYLILFLLFVKRTIVTSFSDLIGVIVESKNQRKITFVCVCVCVPWMNAFDDSNCDCDCDSVWYFLFLLLKLSMNVYKVIQSHYIFHIRYLRPCCALFYKCTLHFDSFFARYSILYCCCYNCFPWHALLFQYHHSRIFGPNFPRII